MKTTGCYVTPRPCRRCLGSHTLSLAVGGTFFLLLVYMMSEELAYRADAGAEVELNISRWIIPVHELTAESLAGEIPDGWTLLVPSDANISCSQCKQDDMAWTRTAYNRLHSANSDASPEAVYSRMVPVLFAIKSQAQQIVLSSDVSHLQTSMPKLFIDNEPDGVTGLEYFSPALASDTYHFHYRNEIDKDSVCMYRIKKCMHPLWTVGLQCKFTTASSGISKHIMLDEQAPPIFTSSPKFSISGSDDGLFEHDGFWAMFKVFVEHGDEASVWGLWAQRLMMELNAEVGLVTLPCPTNASTTAAETKPSEKVQRAYQTVTSWSCPENVEFFRCAVSLAVELHNEGHVTHGTLEALHVWLAELWAVNYTPPQRRKLSSCPVPRIKEGCVIYNPALSLSGGISGLPAYNTLQKLFPAIETKCLNQPKRPGVSDPFKPYVLDHRDNSKVRDIALVLIFYDSSIYNNIIFLEDLHRKYFNQIIYCGPNASHFTSFYAEFKRPISYVEVPNTRGFVAHDCLTRAMMINYQVSGFLEIADDVILNTWTLGSIPRDRFWFQMELRIASRFQQMMQDFAMTFPVPWWPWTTDNQKWGAKALAGVWDLLTQVRTNGSVAAQKTVHDFLEMLQHNSGKPENFFYSSSDIFYVPVIFRRSWTFLGEIFVQNNVFLDIAVPTLMNGIDLTGNIIRMDGTYLWYNNRANYPAHYRGFLNFFHPWKMGWIHQPEHAHFMCYFILPFIVDDLVEKDH
ncbi:hypothetical protein ElyMa_000565600 [Elysia marginata]|uniref:Uncharacterized protein n=1 Tax=Elysia marginata TaxID=1093978 RepID=A0AAV4G3W5_9GAST|nr:hypothetical protein ElyMa_000565600 [Elysia marginata]